MKIKHASKSGMTVGLKQTLKALLRDEVTKVYIGFDSDVQLTLGVREVCLEHNIVVDDSLSMEELGHMVGIKVGAAAVGVLK